jgi:integrase
VLEAEQVRALAEAHEERFRALVYLLAYKGLRIGEAAALRVGDLDLARGTLRVDETLSEVSGILHLGPTKTATGTRTLTLPPFLRDMLAEHLARFSDPKDPNAFVFTMPGGGNLRPNNYRKRSFYPAVRKAGLDEHLTPHDLRDTAATLAFASGATVKEVSDMLGHEKPAITLERYTGVLDSMRAATDEGLERTFREAASRPVPTSAVLRFPDRLAKHG